MPDQFAYQQALQQFAAMPLHQLHSLARRPDLDGQLAREALARRPPSGIEALGTTLMQPPAGVEYIPTTVRTQRELEDYMAAGREPAGIPASDLTLGSPTSPDGFLADRERRAVERQQRRAERYGLPAEEEPAPEGTATGKPFRSPWAERWGGTGGFEDIVPSWKTLGRGLNWLAPDKFALAGDAAEPMDEEVELEPGTRLPAFMRTAAAAPARPPAPAAELTEEPAESIEPVQPDAPTFRFADATGELDRWPIIPIDPAPEPVAAAPPTQAPEPPWMASVPTRRPASDPPVHAAAAATGGAAAPASRTEGGIGAFRARSLDDIRGDLDEIQPGSLGREDRNDALASALLMTGLSMMASRNPSFFGALAEGGIAGLRTWTGERAAQHDRLDREYQRQLERERLAHTIHGTETAREDRAIDRQQAWDLAAESRALQREGNTAADRRHRESLAATQGRPQYEWIFHPGTKRYENWNRNSGQPLPPGFEPVVAANRAGPNYGTLMANAQREARLTADRRVPEKFGRRDEEAWQRVYNDELARNVQNLSRFYPAMMLGDPGFGGADLPPLPPGFELDTSIPMS
jgi:hypothetical protein